MSKPIIQVKDVTMKFDLYSERVDNLKEYFIKRLKKELKREKFTALDSLSFTINKGEVVGIVGKNGCGKSTLLKIISGIYKPTKGKVSISGTIAPLIELGAGFDMDLTGAENIYLNGSILGYSKKYIDEKYQEIIDFAEIGEFINVPLKNYSSGMIARIGFAIATVTQPDILIVDEILAVGDFLFQKKCEDRMNALMQSGTTVIIVSHAIEQIERLCNRVIWIEQGTLKQIGETMEICKCYKTSH